MSSRRPGKDHFTYSSEEDPGPELLEKIRKLVVEEISTCSQEANSRQNRERLFQKQRATLAKKLKNPRLKEIHFHTFRHWKATMLCHQTNGNMY